MEPCDECGGTAMRPLAEGAFECELCGALQGDDVAVSALLIAREAERRGIDKRVYPLVRALERSRSWRVEQADYGDIERSVWPRVQLRPADGSGAVLLAVDALLQSIRLSAAVCEAHWVVEAELAQSLVFTLKPRFHREVDRIDATAVAGARRDLRLLEKAIQRDQLAGRWHG